MTAKKEKSGFSHFFKEDEVFIREVIQEAGKQPEVREEPVKKDRVPVLPQATPAGETDRRAYWRSLRKFFTTGKGGGISGTLQPVVLAPQLTRSLVGLEFPVWINPAYGTDNDLPLSRSLYELIRDALGKIDEKRYDLRILRENFDRILGMVSQELKNGKPALFHPVMEKVTGSLKEQLRMGGSDFEAFTASMDRMVQLLPKDGVLLPYSAQLPYQLLEAVMMAVQEKERRYLLEDIRTVKDRINDVIRVEKDKSAEGRDPDKLKASLGMAGSMLRADALSAFLPESGSEVMDPERLDHITAIARTLEEADSLFSRRSFIVIEKGHHDTGTSGWDQIFEQSELELCEEGSGAGIVADMFGREMGRYAGLFAALRQAELELNGKYQPDLHDDYFGAFTWENLAEEELRCCPFFVLIADAGTLLEKEFQPLSKILTAKLPIKFIGMKTELFPGEGSGKGEADLHSHHELTGLLLSHKNLFVGQCAAITPSILMETYEYGMSAFSPAFFHVLELDERTHEHPMVLSSAMIEGRDFPTFMYAGLLGTPWGSRFNISNNPRPSASWPSHTIRFSFPDGQVDETEFSFTFADQAALFPAYQPYFQSVEPAYWTDDLIPLEEYLERPMDENVGKVPFIWMVDQDDTLQKVAASWQIVMATEERRDQWRFLQENSGVHNFHVERAVRQLREQLEKEHQYKIEALRAEHAAEIEKVRLEEADKVMENLTNALLQLDLSSAAGMFGTPAVRPVAPGPKGTDKPMGQEETGTSAAPAKAEEPEEVLNSEPYIDTPLCTSCNECININGALFKYNGDKMAYIADAKAGTFEELVRAAEQCPVSIIHPGAPMNNKEPGLDELIERAKPYN